MQENPVTNLCVSNKDKHISCASKIPSPPPPPRPAECTRCGSGKQVASGGKIAHLSQQVKQDSLGTACQMQFGLFRWMIRWNGIAQRRWCDVPSGHAHAMLLTSAHSAGTPQSPFILYPNTWPGPVGLLMKGDPVAESDLLGRLHAVQKQAEAFNQVLRSLIVWCWLAFARCRCGLALVVWFAIKFLLKAAFIKLGVFFLSKLWLSIYLFFYI